MRHDEIWVVLLQCLNSFYSSWRWVNHNKTVEVKGRVKSPPLQAARCSSIELNMRRLMNFHPSSLSLSLFLFLPPEFVFPYPEDDRGVQARLVWDQRGLVRLPVFPTKRVNWVSSSYGRFTAEDFLQARQCLEKQTSSSGFCPDCVNMEAGAAVNPFVRSHSAVFCLLQRLVSDVNTSFLLAFCYSRQSYWLWPPSCGCCLCLWHSVFSQLSMRCWQKHPWTQHQRKMAQSSNRSFTWLPMYWWPLKGSRDWGLCFGILAGAICHARAVCVLVVLGHKVCSVPACLRRSICGSLPCLCLVTPFTSECRWEHMSSRTNEKYKLNWTDRDGIKPRREAASQAGRGSHTRSQSMWTGRSARFGSDSVLSSHIRTLIPSARDEEQQ